MRVSDGAALHEPGSGGGQAVDRKAICPAENYLVALGWVWGRVRVRLARAQVRIVTELGVHGVYANKFTSLRLCSVGFHFWFPLRPSS